MPDLEKIQWIRLLGTTRVGLRSFMELIKIFQTAECVIDYLSELNKSGRNRGVIKIPSHNEAKKELEYYEKMECM